MEGRPKLELLPDDPPLRIQIILLAILGTIAVTGPAGVILLYFDATQAIGVWVTIASILLLSLLLGYTRNLGVLRIIHGPARDRGISRQTLDWQVLRVSSILLNLLVIVSGITLILAVVIIAGLGGALQLEQLVILATILLIATGLSLLVAIFQSLRTDYPVSSSPLRDLFGFLLVAGAIVLALSAPFILVDDPIAIELLASLVFIVLAAFIWRDLPTFYSIFTEDKEVPVSGHKPNVTGSTIFPVVVAFGLLFGVLLLFVLFGASAIGELSDVWQKPEFLVLGLVILLAILGSVGAVMFLGKPQKDIELFRAKPDKATTTSRIIVYSSLGAAGVLLIIAALAGADINFLGMHSGRWVDFVALAALAGTAPYGYYAARQYSRIRKLEERFPDFLRDIASSHKGGLTLSASVAIAARGEYGPLSPEIGRMADQMTWNVSFEEAMQRFADRVATPLVRRTVSLIKEASRSGGSASEVLIAAAKDARQIKNMENERRLSMVLYGVIIYITFFVFLMVASVLYNQFVPQIIASAEALELAAVPGGMQIDVASIESYRAFYFISSVVQGMGGGIVAGMMSTGKWVLGLQHSAIMTFIAFITFVLFLV